MKKLDKDDLKSTFDVISGAICYLRLFKYF